LLAITRLNTVHALLYLIVSSLAIGVVMFVIGAPFAAVLEVIIFAGAIMVLFLFVVMVLNLDSRGIAAERRWRSVAGWMGPGLLAIVLFIEMAWVIARAERNVFGGGLVGPGAVGAALFGPYALGVELASVLLLAGLVGAYHVGLRKPQASEKKAQEENQHGANWVESSAASGGDLVHAGDDRSSGTP
jgi:NADH-quinone oxidoreductase subunit J